MLGGAAFGGAVDWRAITEGTEAEYRNLLDTAAEEVGDRAAVTKVLAHGRPGEQTVEQLARGEHDLVVMGSPRARGDPIDAGWGASATRCWAPPPPALC